ncbi:MAG: hypothetical protein AAFQ89_02340 [Cyanobacteria bacterium J06626_18]
MPNYGMYGAIALQENRYMTIAHYPDLGTAIRGVCHAWCNANGYSDPFCRDGEWWAFPLGGVMPIRIKTVMREDDRQPVKIGPVMLIIFPDGSLSSCTER